MTLKSLMKGAGASLALTGALMLCAQPALAQSPGTTQNAPAAQNPPSSSPAPTGSRSGRVMLGDYAMAVDPETGEREMAPRPITTGDIGYGTRTVDYTEYSRDYPIAARLGWFEEMRRSDEMHCRTGNDLVDRLLEVDAELLTEDEQFAAIQEIYNQLPDEVRRATRISRTSAVVGGAAGCILSLGLYCVTSVSNATQSWVNAGVYQSLNLAHIKLSLANVRTSRSIVKLARINIDGTLLWVAILLPMCGDEHPETVQ